MHELKHIEHRNNEKMERRKAIEQNIYKTNKNFNLKAEKKNINIMS